MSQWRKAIPEKRDRLQSRLLVWLVGPVLLFYFVQGLTRGVRESGWCFHAFLAALGLSIVLAGIVWITRAGTWPAAVFGGMICFIITSRTMSCNNFALYSGFAPLLTMLVLTLGASKVARKKRPDFDAEETRTGRSAAQVIANLGVAALACAPLNPPTHGGPRPGWLLVVGSQMLIAALVEAAADTVSSEIGQAFGGRPFLLTKFRRVDPGIDGAVSLLGTLAGVAAGTVVAAGALFWIWNAGLHYNLRDFAIDAVEFSLAAGLIGFFFDTALGATIERRGWLGNDLVNFMSTLIAAFVASQVWLTWR